MQVVKRTRDPIFQMAEKVRLLQLVEKYYDIIECKKTTTEVSRAKQIKWIQISNEFNATLGRMPRQWRVLRNLWQNMKKKAKVVMKQGNNMKHESGDEFQIKLDVITKKVISLLASADFDASLKAEVVIEEQDHVSDNIEYEYDTEEANTTMPKEDWNFYTANVLQDAQFVKLDAEVGKLSRKECCPEQAEEIQSDTEKQSQNTKEDNARQDVAMRILLLQEEQEKEKLKQEKLKTKIELLRLQQEQIKLEQIKVKFASIKNTDEY